MKVTRASVDEALRTSRELVRRATETIARSEELLGHMRKAESVFLASRDRFVDARDQPKVGRD